MTDCLRTDIRDVLPDWVHGSLGDAEATKVAAHVATCEACSAEVELLRAVRAAVPREPLVDVQRIAAGVVARTARQKTARRSGWPMAAAGIALAASVAFGLLFIQGDQKGANRTVATMQSADTNRMTTTPDDSTLPRDTGGVRQRNVAPDPVSPLPEPELRVALVSGGLDDLEVDELEALLRQLDGIEALPQTSPAPLFTPDLEVR